MTASCWTRCLYRYPPWAIQTWEYWYDHLPPEEQTDLPTTLPKKWRKDKAISDEIIWVCPACAELQKSPNDIEKRHFGTCAFVLYVTPFAGCSKPML
jgi:hypothetical protein